MVNKIGHYFGFAMVAVYLALGLLFLFTDAAIDLFPNYRTEVGLLMLAYAIYRSIMTYRKIKQSNTSH